MKAQHQAGEWGEHEKKRVGLVGLGLMGSALAERFLAAGLGVLGYDLVPERMTACARAGVIPASGAAQVAAECRRVVLSVFDGVSVREVLRAMDAQLRPGQVIVDTTTGDVATAEESAAWLAARGLMYVDATISGNREQASKGEVTVLAGGTPEALEQCLDLLKLFAREVLHVGEAGAGTKMKLVTNLALGLNRAVLAETLVFARAIGLEQRRALEILRSSMGYSRVMDTKGEKMISGDFTPHARIAQHLKDVRLIVEAGRRQGLEMPLSCLHQRLLERAVAGGLGQLDNAALIQVLGRPPSAVAGATAFPAEPPTSPTRSAAGDGTPPCA